MGALTHQISQETLLIILALAALFALVLWVSLSNRAKFHWLMFRYDFPLFGRLARLGRSGDQRAGGSKWYLSERELCGDFHRFHPEPPTRDQYDKATSYLSKAQELGRRDLPALGWIVVFVLLTAEALSFGILLAGYIAQNATLREQTWLGYLAATVLAIILLWLTHTAGRELHNNSLISKAREWFSGRPTEEQGKALRPYSGVSLQKNELDDQEPIYIQLAGRVSDHSGGKFRPSFLFPGIALVVILGFGALSFYIRTELFQQLQTHQTMGDSTDSQADGASSDDINRQLGGATAEVEKKGQNDAQTAGARAAIAAFGALALLFFAMQIIGVSVGYFFGFAGRESKGAAHIRGRFRTAEEYLEFQRAYRDYVARHAQARLTRLQRKVRALTNDANFDQNAAERTFRTYAVEKLDERAMEEKHGASARSAASPPELRRVVVDGKPADVSAGSDAALRQRIEAEITEKLKKEQLEAQLRAEIEVRLRAERGMDKPA